MCNNALTEQWKTYVVSETFVVVTISFRDSGECPGGARSRVLLPPLSDETVAKYVLWFIPSSQISCIREIAAKIIGTNHANETLAPIEFRDAESVWDWLITELGEKIVKKKRLDDTDAAESVWDWLIAQFG
jgi:hypothetical protein